MAILPASWLRRLLIRAAVRQRLGQLTPAEQQQLPHVIAVQISTEFYYDSSWTPASKEAYLDVVSSEVVRALAEREGGVS